MRRLGHVYPRFAGTFWLEKKLVSKQVDLHPSVILRGAYGRQLHDMFLGINSYFQAPLEARTMISVVFL